MSTTPTKPRFSRKTTIAALGVIGVAGLAGTAFAASITGLSTSNAGQGAATIAGYNVTDGPNITGGDWTSGNGTTTDVSTVEFTMTKTGGGGITDANTSVYAQLTGGTASNWVACTVGSANVVSCDFASANKPVDEITGVSIVAYDK